MTVHNAMKPLSVLQEQWSACTRCALGEHRIAAQEPFLWGEGVPRGIMFVGTSPSDQDVSRERIYSATGAGSVLRDALSGLGLDQVSYLTNIVVCRSCGPAYNGQNQVIMRKGRALIRDQAPMPPYVEACKPRLMEEIYLIDPVLIVALGALAATTLLGRTVRIMAESGTIGTTKVTGATRVPMLTAKKRVWLRKVRGQLTAPTTPFQVEYPTLLCIHPFEAFDRAADRRKGSPKDKFVTTLQLAKQLYARYLQETT